MTNTPSNKPIQKSREISSIDPSLKELSIEAKNLFEVLDSTSNTIRKLEACLKELKMHFPFRHKICEEKESPPKPVEEHHRAAYPCVHGYRTKIYWYLAWEHEEESKSYRLCLISEENDIIAYSVDDDTIYQDDVPTKKILLKKPLIATELSIRLRYAPYLLPFVNAFKEHIRSSRIWIEEGMLDLPF